MSSVGFEIPLEFSRQLRYVDAKDNRSDDEIIHQLSQHQPVTSEKNIWAFWHSGLETVPPWVKRNIVSWVRINGSEWTVRVLDSKDESPNNALKYIPTELLPECFVKGTMTGPYIGPHSADFLRGACLYRHGGVFLDVGSILVTTIDKLCWNSLSSNDTPYNVAVPLMYGQVIANAFTASRAGDPFIRRWHELFVHVWKGHNDSQGLLQNPLISFAATLDFADSQANDLNWDFNVEPQTVAEYVSQVMCWLRLTMLQPPEGATGEDGFDCSEYWMQHVLVFNSLQECWGAELVVGFGNSLRIIELLTVSRSADPESKDYKDAYALVWRLLTSSSTEKVTHGKGLTKATTLGTLLDMPENQDVDCRPGTFGELLRYGCVHFEQTRDDISLVKATRPKIIMRKGVLEA